MDRMDQVGPEKRTIDRRTALVVVGLLTLAALVLRFWRLAEMPLFGDEAYYLLWADRPALAYADHPAGIALLVRLSTALANRDELGVRWLNALVSIACVPLAYAVGRSYVNAMGGLVMAAGAALAPVFVITGRVAYPDALLTALTLTNLLLFAGLLAGRHNLWRWALWGLTLGLMANVKLTTGFYVVALGAYLLIWRRELLRERGLWLAVAIGLLATLPVLVWNASHDLAGLRQAMAQGSGYGLEVLNPARRLYHAFRYHTPPVVALAALGTLGGLVALRRALTWPRTAPNPSASELPAQDAKGFASKADGAQAFPAGQSHPPDSRPMVLLLVAVAFLLPILLSRANNPRNLQLGVLALLPLVGLVLRPPAFAQSGKAPTEGRGVAASERPGLIARLRGGPAYLATLLLLAGMALYAAGTAVELADYRGRWPHSIGAQSVSFDAAGWPVFARDFRPPLDALAFALDYSIAPRIAHYGGYPVYTAHTQYRLWGIPPFDNLAVVSQGYLPEAEIEARLRQDFAQVTGPDVYTLGGKVVRVWQARGRRAPIDQVVDDLDYLNILRGASLLLK